MGSIVLAGAGVAVEVVALLPGCLVRFLSRERDQMQRVSSFCMTFYVWTMNHEGYEEVSLIKKRFPRRGEIHLCMMSALTLAIELSE